MTQTRIRFVSEMNALNAFWAQRVVGEEQFLAVVHNALRIFLCSIQVRNFSFAQVRMVIFSFASLFYF